MQPAPGPRRPSVARVAVDAWPPVVAALLLLPLLTRPGIPLARDLVFVPQQPLTDAAFGLGDAAPRAVPLDAVVSLATVVVDGGLLARVALLLVLATAGWGASRLVGELGAVARLVAGGLAVWNPYTVERLALGQWALLAAYAALPWIAMAATRWRRRGRPVDLASVVLWLALASLTPTGGLLGAVTTLAFGLGRGPTLRRAAGLAASVVLLQLPWLLPALVGEAGATSDPDGVAAFAARAEGPGGVVVAVLGLGGIWDAGSVPGTRETWWGTVAMLLVVLALVVGGRRLWRTRDRGDLLRWAALATGGLALALLSSAGWGAAALGWAVETVPGAGLLRDSQKLAAPYVVVVVAATAAAVQVVLDRARAWGSEVGVALAVTAVALPLALLPDATAAVWPTVDPVRPSGDLDAVAAVVDGSGQDVVTLPWRSYRRFAWGNGLISSDPATRWFDADVLVDDSLRVGDVVVAGEGARTRAVGEALADSPPAEALGRLGVGWVVLYRDDPDAEAVDLAGLEERYAGPDLALYAVPGVSPGPDDTGTGDVAVLVADLLAAFLVLAAAVLRLGRRRTRGTGSAVVR